MTVFAVLPSVFFLTYGGEGWKREEEKEEKKKSNTSASPKKLRLLICLYSGILLLPLLVTKLKSSWYHSLPQPLASLSPSSLSCPLLIISVSHSSPLAPSLSVSLPSPFLWSLFLCPTMIPSQLKGSCLCIPNPQTPVLDTGPVYPSSLLEE